MSTEVKNYPEVKDERAHEVREKSEAAVLEYRRAMAKEIMEAINSGRYSNYAYLFYKYYTKRLLEKDEKAINEQFQKNDLWALEHPAFKTPPGLTMGQQIGFFIYHLNEKEHSRPPKPTVPGGFVTGGEPVGLGYKDYFTFAVDPENIVESSGQALIGAAEALPEMAEFVKQQFADTGNWVQFKIPSSPRILHKQYDNCVVYYQQPEQRESIRRSVAEILSRHTTLEHRISYDHGFDMTSKVDVFLDTSWGGLLSRRISNEVRQIMGGRISEVANHPIYKAVKSNDAEAFIKAIGILEKEIVRETPEQMVDLIY